MLALIFISLFLSFFSTGVIATAPKTLNTSSISTQELNNFSENSLEVKNLIKLALNLATKNLGYLYGLADTKNGGLDCSGTIYYLLNQLKVREVPRSSESIYEWVREKGDFHAVNRYEFSSSEFNQLQPGYLLFWGGTYQTKEKVNATHVMIYLRKE